MTIQRRLARHGALSVQRCSSPRCHRLSDITLLSNSLLLFRSLFNFNCSFLYPKTKSEGVSANLFWLRCELNFCFNLLFCTKSIFGSTFNFVGEYLSQSKFHFPPHDGTETPGTETHKSIVDTESQPK